MFSFKNSLIRSAIAVALSALAFALIACKNPTATPSNKISGTISDSVTGAGLPNAQVMIGKYTATSDASGNFSITLDSGVTTVSGDVAVTDGTGYDFLFDQGATIDAAGGLNNFNVPLVPVTTPATTVTISGTAQDSSGTQLANGDMVAMTIYNQAGGSTYVSTSYTGSGYTLTTPTFGPKCFVVVELTPSGQSSPQAVYYLSNQDLSSPTTTLNLSAPTTGYTTVSGTGAAFSTTTSDTVAAGLMVPGYGVIPIAMMSLSSSSFSLPLHDPDNYQVVWEQYVSAQPATNTYAIQVETSTSESQSNAVSLSPLTVTAPTSYDDVSSATYSSSGTLNFTASNDAMGSLVILGTSQGLSGYLWMTGGSVTLPTSIQNIIAKETGWSISAYGANTSGLSFDQLDQVVLSGGGSSNTSLSPTGTQIGISMGPNSTNSSFGP